MNFNGFALALVLCTLCFNDAQAYPRGKPLLAYRPTHYFEVSKDDARPYEPTRRIDYGNDFAVIVYVGERFKEVLLDECHQNVHTMPHWLCPGSRYDEMRVSNLELASQKSVEVNNVVAAFRVILFPSIPEKGVPLVVHDGETTADIVRKGLDICERFGCSKTNVEAFISMAEAIVGNNEEPRLLYELSGAEGWACNSFLVRVSRSGEDLLSTVMAAVAASECADGAIEELMQVEGTATMSIVWSVQEYATSVHQVKGALDSLPMKKWTGCPSSPEGNGIEMDVCVLSTIHGKYIRVPSLDLGYLGAEEWFHDSWAVLVAENTVYKRSVPRKRDFSMSCIHENYRFHSYGSVLDRSTDGLPPLFLMGLVPELPDDVGDVRADLSPRTGMSKGTHEWNRRLNGHKSLAQDEFGKTWEVLIEEGCYLAEHIPVFKDPNVGVGEGYVYKAVVKIRGRKETSGCSHLPLIESSQDLHAVGSVDGLKWQLLRNDPCLRPIDQVSFRWFDTDTIHRNKIDPAAAVFDSPACTMYDGFHKVYRIFARLNTKKGARHVQTAWSRDFLHWSKLQPVSVRGLDGVQLFPYLHFTPKGGPFAMSYDPSNHHPKSIGFGMESFYFASVFPSRSNPKILLGSWSRCFRVGLTCDVVLLFSRDGGLSWTRSGDNINSSRHDLSAWIRGNPTVLDDEAVAKQFVGEFDYKVLPIMGTIESHDDSTDIYVLESPLHKNASVMQYTVEQGIFGWIESDPINSESTVITRTLSMDSKAQIYAQIAVLPGVSSAKISAALLTHEGLAIPGFTVELSTILFSRSTSHWQLVPLSWSNQFFSAEHFRNMDSSSSRAVVRVRLVFSNMKLARLVLK